MDILRSLGSLLKTLVGVIAFWRPKPGPDVKPLPVSLAPPPVPREFKKP